MNNVSAKDRIAEIDEELQQLRATRTRLLEERARLKGPVTVPKSRLWAQIVFAVIESNPGSSRDTVRELLTEDIPENELTNVLTTLRRRGWIHNFGTRKKPLWHVRELEVRPTLTIPAITPEQLYLQDERRRERDIEDRRWAYYHRHGVYPRWMQ